MMVMEDRDFRCSEVGEPTRLTLKHSIASQKTRTQNRVAINYIYPKIEKGISEQT